MSSPPGWWSSRGWVACLLYPVSWLFALAAGIRYRQRVMAARVPVIVVGNLSVGGTGKSPLVAHLVARLRDRGHRVGIVSRGYGGLPQRTPVMVERDSDPSQVGDEPVMHARLSGVPVCVCIDRPLAVARLVEGQVDVILSDDGLQHYAMARTLEIAVVDGQRGFGNGWLLPAGPLREPLSRLQSVDLVAVQKAGGAVSSRVDELPGLSTLDCAVGAFLLQIDTGVCLASGHTVDLASLPAATVHAVTGLGNPRRFFDSLAARGLSVIEHAFADHHHYTAEDMIFADAWPVLVTSKDAVKIERLAIDLSRFVEVRVVLQPDDQLASGMESLLARLPAPARFPASDPHECTEALR